MATRIYTLAKELKLDNKVLVDICNRIGITGKGSALASLSDEEVAAIKVHLGGAGRKPAAGRRRWKGRRPGRRLAAVWPRRPVRAATIMSSPRRFQRRFPFWRSGPRSRRPRSRRPRLTPSPPALRPCAALNASFVRGSACRDGGGMSRRRQPRATQPSSVRRRLTRVRHRPFRCRRKPRCRRPTSRRFRLPQPRRRRPLSRLGRRKARRRPRRSKASQAGDSRRPRSRIA